MPEWSNLNNPAGNVGYSFTGLVGDNRGFSQAHADAILLIEQDHVQEEHHAGIDDLWIACPEHRPIHPCGWIHRTHRIAASAHGGMSEASLGQHLLMNIEDLSDGSSRP